ncbi:hypothetical protein J3D54_005191 [Pseudomonas sp. GGS8]|uniref:hypothetical protein n=1 Tax=Pseudomonas sp. GGS8 TaxID=2817892 RepID=UPI0020A010E2|nr:hypothetical protein [Pseudomonas sp. GGS8]MCP1446059.1 hypothetical protein [Pseudomonas sp. GGS8]
MRPTLSAAFITLFVSLSGCAKDYSLAPPPDSEQITVTVKVPKELEAGTMKAMYHSSICKQPALDVYGGHFELDRNQLIDIQPIRLGQTDIYEANVPMNGGGACQWRLGNVLFGVVYSEPSILGENVTYGEGGDILLIVDSDKANHDDSYITVEGDLTIKSDYYPWLSESFPKGHGKQINLAEGDSIYWVRRGAQVRQVHFEPVLHSDFLVKSEVMEDSKFSGRIKVTYPDGTVDPRGRDRPDFQKLQALRLSAERK